MSNGKGSSRRPMKVSLKEYDDNYDLAFKKKKEPEQEVPEEKENNEDNK